MVKINNKNEIFIKILYWGPESAGKTKTIETLHELTKNKGVFVPSGDITKTTSESGATIYFDRDILVDKENFFDSLNPKGSEFKDSKIASMISRDFHETKFTEVYFHLYSVGGNPAFREQRKKIFSGTDGIIFVFDGNKTHWEDNVQSLKELKKVAGDSLINKIPLVVMLNKCDLPNIIQRTEVETLLKKEKLMLESNNEQHIWNPVIFETISLKNKQKGIYEAFEEILRRTGLYLKFGKIPIPRGEETTRINLTIPRSLKTEWDEFAKKTLKTSLSQMIRNAVRQYRHNYTKLLEEPKQADTKDPLDKRIEKIVSEKFDELMKTIEKR